MPLKDFHTRKIFVKVRRKSKISDCLRTQNGGENLPGKEIDNYRMKNCLNIFSRSVVVVVVVVVVVSDVGRKDKIKIRSFFYQDFLYSMLLLLLLLLLLVYLLEISKH